MRKIRTILPKIKVLCNSFRGNDLHNTPENEARIKVLSESFRGNETDNTPENEARIKTLWLASYTNAEIGEAVGLDERRIRERIKVIGDSFRGNDPPVTPENDDEDDGEEESTGGVGGGLGATIQTLKNLCRDDTEATDLIDQMIQRPVGNPTFGETPIVDNINNKEERPNGTSREYALRRLREQNPEIHARVIAGESRPAQK